MQPLIRKLKIHVLKRRLESSRLRCDSLAIKFDEATTAEHRAELVRLWDQAMAQSHALQHALAVLERRQTKTSASAD
jgi:hypothetical protein